MQLIKPGTHFDFVGRIRLFGGLSVGLVLLSLVGIATRGFNWGIDFAGGTELQVRFEKDVKTADIRKALVDLGFKKNQVQPFGAADSHEYLVRVERITSLSTPRVDDLRSKAIKSFGPQRLHAFSFEPREGDRIIMDFEVPAAVAASPAAAHDVSGAASHVAEQDPKKALITREAKRYDTAVSTLSDEIGRFFKDNSVELRHHDALQFGQLRGDRLEVTVYFKGVADRVVQSFAKIFGEVENRRTDYVDSNVSKELRTDGLLAIVYALFGILIYIAVRFDFYFSPGAVVALVHDVSITMGVFAWAQIEFDLTTVAALLTIVGYSLNDTIVVYDRIRETVPSDDKFKGSIGEFVNRAINDTLSRTLLTSVTTLLVIIALLIFATGVILHFGVAMCIGVLVGTYSSVFVASPVYLALKKAMPAGR